MFICRLDGFVRNERDYYTRAERDALFHTWFHSHHAQLDRQLAGVLERRGWCPIADYHSSTIPNQRLTKAAYLYFSEPSKVGEITGGLTQVRI